MQFQRELQAEPKLATVHDRVPLGLCGAGGAMGHRSLGPNHLRSVLGLPTRAQQHDRSPARRFALRQRYLP